jgi:hypothetical protein
MGASYFLISGIMSLSVSRIIQELDENHNLL